MKFVGKVWKLLVGIKDGLVLLLMLLFFGMIYAAMTARPTIGAGEKGALLLALRGPIVEQPAVASPADVLGGGVAREYRLRDVVHSLRKAKGDARVQAVALDLDIFSGGGQATLSAVGDALDELKRSGKPVLAYASAYDDDSYLLASHASEIWLNPMGGVVVTGPGGSNLYFKGLLDRLGVTANIYRVGTYKAAVEPVTRNDMSPEAREALQAVYGSMWSSWQDEVRRVRPKAQVAAYAADAPGRIAASGGDMARAALAAGLVDRVGDKDAFGKRLAQITGAEFESVPGSFRSIAYDAWAEAYPANEEEGGGVGILTVAGNIVDGEAGPGTAGAETIVKALADGLRDRDLKALVLRVDSSGGSALASERIRQAVLAAKAKGLPVVVSMGSLAASGGYWIAAAGDRIYAEPSTITGSIGVFGILPSFEGSLAKLGIGADGVKTTPLSGEPDLLRGPSPEADRMMQSGVENIYRRFLTIVSQARKLPVQRVDQIAQGRIWDGGTARQLGLVDAFGGLEDAVAEAARLAKLEGDDAKPVWLEAAPSFADELLLALASDDQEQAATDVFGRVAARQQRLMGQALIEVERLMAGGNVQARCLECPAATSTLQVRAAARTGLGSWLLRLLGV
ncbi:MAG TPA: signal peptide peptidase SppA [Allosphingosinicella sp.]|jgi:protease-4